MSPLTAQHWVFDMDGTLTRDIHDFELIRRTLRVPEGADILAHLDTLPPEEADAHYRWLCQYEHTLAERAEAADGILALLTSLKQQGAALGILTRNVAPMARLTLERAGLLAFFSDGTVLGRDDAAPKPSPDGLHRLAHRWQVAPSALIMVGDSIIDIQTGRAAGAYTVLLHADDSAARRLAHLHMPDARTLLAQRAAAMAD